MSSPLHVPPWPVPFALDRLCPSPGSTATGRVAAGVVWPSGHATLRWQATDPPPGHCCPVHQVATYASAEDMVAVHGHAGTTVMVPGDPRAVPPGWGLRLFALLRPTRRGPGEVWFWGVQWGGDGPVATVTVRLPAADGGPAVTYFPHGGVRTAHSAAGVELEAAAGRGIGRGWVGIAAGARLYAQLTRALRDGWGRVPLDLVWLDEATPTKEKHPRRLTTY